MRPPLTAGNGLSRPPGRRVGRSIGHELDRELWEIDENLIRAELTEIERGLSESTR